jgi:hypothetical protein
MALQAVLSRLVGLVTDVAGPLLPALRTPPPRARVEKTLAQVDPGAPGAARSGEPGAPVAEAMATSQLVSLRAEPPLRWQAGAEAGWRCSGKTSIAITSSDGQERQFRYPAGTLIRVTAGMILLPPWDESPLS